jgi:hypothetical protein
MSESMDYHVLNWEKFFFRFDEREIVSWQGISSFSTPLNAGISGKKRWGKA